MSRKKLLISHRGFHSGRVRENTLSAFEAALSMGATGVETDVRVCADGVPVLFHDRVICDVEVETLSHRKLIGLCGYQVPTLEKAIQSWPHIFWNLDVKTPAALDSTLGVLKRNSAHRVLVSSCHHHVFSERSKPHHVRYGLIVAHHPASFDALLPASARIDTIVWDMEIVTENLILEASVHRMRSIVYGAGTVRELERLREWPLEGLITDRLDLCRESRG